MRSQSMYFNRVHKLSNSIDHKVIDMLAILGLFGVEKQKGRIPAGFGLCYIVERIRVPIEARQLLCRHHYRNDNSDRTSHQHQWQEAGTYLYLLLVVDSSKIWRYHWWQK